ncbi:TetR/AcrR family transcriptional regulator [Novosphingobium sp. KCTC 2891]|nr:TetR/AcrR family transcriptional regulator [Novosphingobium sp. KCTC 2891]
MPHGKTWATLSIGDHFWPAPQPDDMLMPHPNEGESRPRGRPRSQIRHDIPDELLRALRVLLEERTHGEITLKDVAERAGTSQEMVRYYFGSKDGLITAMLRQTASRITEVLAGLERDIVSGIVQARGDNPTRLVITTLIDIYMSERAATRVALIEFEKSHSLIRDEHLSKRSGLIVSKLHDIVRLLIEQGVYAATLDARHVAVSIMVLAGSPVRLLPALSPEWITEETIVSDVWVDHLVTMIDGYCRA